ncbi:transposase [Geitlerinema sp. PCC 7407]|nr:transposase [Geitlerinema sp. PCC 7407]
MRSETAPLPKQLENVRTAYQYRLRPTSSQIAFMSEWLELLRRQYNYRLGERFSWYEQNRCDINACPLICHLPERRENPDFYSQKRDLVNSKALFPEYQQIHSQVLQDCIGRVKKTFDRWLKGDCNGKRSGRPRFKSSGRYRSFTFPQIKQDCIQGKQINLPKIGWVKLIQHRPLPEGFKIKTATVSQKVDGWYVTLSLEDSSVPALTPDVPSLENTIAIDLGLKTFLVDDSGKEEPIPQHYRKAEKRLKRLQRSLSRKKKGSNRRKKAVKRVAKAHLKVLNQRKDFHYKTANKLLSKGKHIAHEKLNIRGIARSKLAKSTHDAGWGQFLQILAIKAERAGLLTIAVNPSGTSQNCSGCGVKVPKILQDRIHTCPECGLTIDRDHNVAINIKYLAVGHSVNKAQETPDGLPGVTEKPTPDTSVSV